jgi:hypothetical protein
LFKELGLSAKDANGHIKSADVLLSDLSRNIQGMSATQQVGLLSTLMGGHGGGAALLPLLKEGPAALAAYRAEAEKLGGVMSEQDVKASLEFQQSLKQLLFIFTGVRNELGVALMPALKDLIGDFREWIEANREWLRLEIADYARETVKWIERLGEAIEGANTVVEKIGGWRVVFAGFAAGVAAFVAGSTLVDLADMLWGTAAAVQGVAIAVGALDVATGTFEAEALLPLGLLIAGVGGELLMLTGFMVGVVEWLTAIYLVGEDVYGFFVGWDSVLGRVVSYMDTSGNPAIHEFAELMLALREAVDALVNDPAWPAFEADVVAVFNAVGDAIRGALKEYTAFIDAVTAPEAAILGGIFGGAASGLRSFAGAERAREAPAARAAPQVTIHAPININGSGLDQRQLTGAVHAALQEHARGILDAGRGY